MTKFAGTVGASWLLACVIAISSNAPLPFSSASQSLGSKARIATDAFVESQLNK